MGVSEVWFWEDGVLSLHHLFENDYQAVEQSQLLPDFPMDLFCRYITYHDQFDAVTEFTTAVEQA
jgi:hypothetical protein